MIIYKFQQCKLQNGDGIFGKYKTGGFYQGNYRGELDLTKGTFSLFNFSKDKTETIRIEELESLDKS